MLYITYIKLCISEKRAAFLIFPSVLWLFTLHLQKTKGPETRKEAGRRKSFPNRSSSIWCLQPCLVLNVI